MRVLVDADGSPVVDITIRIARGNEIPCFLICDTNHYNNGSKSNDLQHTVSTIISEEKPQGFSSPHNCYFEREGATTITVDQGADSADYFIANLAQPGDVIVTGDYGLAALCLSKQAVPISQDGMIYTDDNIGSLLEQRAMSAKLRRGGGRLSGPSKRTEQQNAAFAKALSELFGNLK